MAEILTYTQRLGLRFLARATGGHARRNLQTQRPQIHIGASCTRHQIGERHIHDTPSQTRFSAARISQARQTSQTSQRRWLSTTPTEVQTTPETKQQGPEATETKDAPKRDVPSYDMTFTCKVCTERSTHRISKQGYERGTVLVTCPGCKNRHLIADHLKIFSDKRITLEDIMREKGQLVKRGSLSADGDLEMWDEGPEAPEASDENAMKK